MGGGGEPRPRFPNFQKSKSRLYKISLFRGGLRGKRGRGDFLGRRRKVFSFYIKNKLQSKIFNNKKRFKTKMFFSVIAKNSNWEILTKNLVTFIRWDGVKDEKV